MSRSRVLSPLLIFLFISPLTSCRKDPIATNPLPTPTTTTPLTSFDDALGFNLIWMHGASYNSPSTTFAEITTALKDLKSPMVRFPGGTIGNYYHFNGKDYGSWVSGNQCIGRPASGENFIQRFSQVASDAKIPVAYVLNVNEHLDRHCYTEGDTVLKKENLDALEYLLQRNIKIPIIEVGNELSIYPSSFGLAVTDWINPLIYNDKNKMIAIVKPSIDRYEQLLADYKISIHQLFARYGQPDPHYGAPIHPILEGNPYRHPQLHYFHEYWNLRVKTMQIDAVIPHNYINLGTNSDTSATISAAITDINAYDRILTNIDNFYPGKQKWITEFNIGLSNLNTSDVPDSIAHTQLLEQAIQTFQKHQVRYYHLHLLFQDSSGHAVIYKTSTTKSHPVNGVPQSGRAPTLNPQYQKNLFYSPLFCWAARRRQVSESEYLTLQNNYGCPIEIK